MAPVRRRKPKNGLLSASSLKQATALGGVLFALWQGWEARQRADSATADANTARVYAGASAGRWRGRVDSLNARVAVLERRVWLLQSARRLPDEVQFGPEPAPAGWKPESHGFLWRLTHPMGDR